MDSFWFFVAEVSSISVSKYLNFVVEASLVVTLERNRLLLLFVVKIIGSQGIFRGTILNIFASHLIVGDQYITEKAQYRENIDGKPNSISWWNEDHFIINMNKPYNTKVAYHVTKEHATSGMMKGNNPILMGLIS
ncbi:hypothetical protein ACJX0J_034461, partial [Zea mays]